MPYCRFTAARQTTTPRSQLPTAKAQLHRSAVYADVDDASTFGVDGWRLTSVTILVLDV